MARIRGVKPEFFTDPDIGELSRDARLLFIGLWTQADREGRLVDDIRQLKIRLFPYDDDINLDRVNQLLAELQDKKMIHRYAGVKSDPAPAKPDSTAKVHECDCIWITHFTRHQRPHHAENASLISEWTPETLERDGVKPVSDLVQTGQRRGRPAGSLILDPGIRTSTGAAEIGQPSSSQPNGKSLGLPSVAPGVLEIRNASSVGADAPFAAIAAQGGIRTPERSTTTTNTKAPNGHPSLLVGEPSEGGRRVEASRKQRPVFFGSRFSVFDWQLRELEAMVGTDAFDVLGFLFELDSRHNQSGQIIPRDGVWLWLQQQVLGEARRRGMTEMPMASDLSKASLRMMNSIARIEAEERAEKLALANGDDDDA